MNSVKKHLNKYVIAFIVITGFHCAAAAVAPVFVALIGAKQWVDKSVLPADHHFNFFSLTNEDSNYSKFEGNENFNGQSLHFTGSYTNHDIQFKYDADALEGRASKTYKGTVNDASNVMTLKGTDATDPLPAVTLNYP